MSFLNFGSWYPCVRQITPIANQSKVVYLTFDDGPDLIGTPAVLDCLKESGVKATFFFIAQKAKTHPKIVQRTLREGHSIGNHSLDHSYGIFFRGQKKMRSWIREAEQVWLELGLKQTVGFRPPAGVRTPELMRATAALDLPLILWSLRFYDTIFCWTKRRAWRSLPKLRAGDIVLLHDRQKPQNLATFISTLAAYIAEIKNRGFVFAELTRSLCEDKDKD